MALGLFIPPQQNVNLSFALQLLILTAQSLAVALLPGWSYVLSQKIQSSIRATGRAPTNNPLHSSLAAATQPRATSFRFKII